MKIHDFSIAETRGYLRELFFDYFRRANFVPFFGSGFSRGVPAKNGVVPSVDQLKEKLVDITAQVKGYQEGDRLELSKMDISHLAEYFWDAMDSQNGHAYHGDFSTYLDNHFCGVHDLPVEQTQVINCMWRYIYTLNYDDAIENASNDELLPIIPYDSQDKSWLEQKRCLYKIHGDAKRYLNTGNSRYCILSTQQYLTAICDPENGDMLEKLETDFSSNNLIFIGCSLLDELDMLFVAGTKFSQKKKENKDTHSFYVRYLGDNAPKLTRIQQQDFERFAITDIIEVSAEDMPAFYSLLFEASKAASVLQKEDVLSDFLGFAFSKLDFHNKKNIEYLFYSSYVLPNMESKEIVLPSYFTRREVAQEIIERINAGLGALHVLRGGRLSGKTYVLIDLLQEFQSKNIFFFSSGKQISDDCLARLLSNKDTILLFDENSLTYEQITKITKEHRPAIEENRIQIVIAIDRSIGMFTKHYFDAFPEMTDFVQIHFLSSFLNNSTKCAEIDQFNNEFGKLGLLDYENGWSILDFIIKVDETCVQKHRALLPEINVIDEGKKLKTLVLFANQDSISISEANNMDITDVLFRLCETASVAIQKDSLLEMELRTGIHDSFRFVVNSKYWVYKCLSAYASNSSHYGTIADTFYEIVVALQRKYKVGSGGRISQNYYQSVKPYYFLNTIQYTFFSQNSKGGSLSLANLIYEKLLPLFKDDFQFLHQKAKCLLWNSRLQESAENRLNMLNEASQQISRAYQLTEKKRPFNMEYTLYHMDVTKTLILTNSWRYCRAQLQESAQSELLTSLLTSFYQMQQQMDCWGDDDDSEIDDRELQDIEWFISELASGDTKKFLSAGNRKIAGQIVTHAFQRR